MYLKRTHPNELSSLLKANRRYFLELHRLCGLLHEGGSGKFSRTLHEVGKHISNSLEVSEWPQELLLAYIELAGECFSLALEEEFKKSGPKVGLQHQADWLVALAGFLQDFSARTQVIVFRLWVKSRLTMEDHIGPIEHSAHELIASFEPIEEHADSFIVSACIELALRLLLRSSEERSEADIEVVRSWCIEFAHDPRGAGSDIVEFISTGFGFSLATPILPVPIDEATSSNGQRLFSEDAAVSRPNIFSIPAIDDPEGERIDLIFELIADTSGTTKQTAEQISRLNRGQEADAASVFFHAARDLWDAWFKEGLDRIQVLERLAIQAYYMRGENDNRRKSALKIWICAQTTHFLLSWPINAILKDIAQLFTSVGINADERDIDFYQIIIEACAGAARAREIEGDINGHREIVETLTKNNGHVIRRYEEHYKRLRRRADPSTLTAIAYLKASGTPSSGGGAGSSGRIVDDKSFEAVIRRGSNNELRDFIEGRTDVIVSLLQRRLKLDLSPENMIVPTGAIYTSRSNLDPVFQAAKAFFSKREYRRAAALFEQLKNRLEGRNRDIAIDYYAYCVAQEHEEPLARLALADLRSDYSYASGYWNSACVLPSDQPAERLELLLRGLKHAPSVPLLNGVISLSLHLNRIDLLKSYLILTTFTESLLLHYMFTFLDLDEKQRSELFLAIVKVAVEGEAPALDPIARLDHSEVAQYVNMLNDRGHHSYLDFWLSCREPSNKNRPDFFEVQSSYLEANERFQEAAIAFGKEVRARLSIIRDMSRRQFSLEDKRLSGSTYYFRKRVERVLPLLAGNSFKQEAARIYKQIERFSEENNIALERWKVFVLPQEKSFSRLFDLAADVAGTTVRETASEFSQLPTTSSPAQIGPDLVPEDGRPYGAALHQTNALEMANATISGLIVSGVDGEKVEIGPSLGNRVLAIRIFNEADGPFFFKQAAAAFVKTRTILNSRDRLEDVPFQLKSGCSLILSFEVPATERPEEGDLLDVMLIFAPPGSSDLAHHAICKLTMLKELNFPGRSPYIHSRMIEANEIAGHFFGRQKEKQAILNSVSRGQQRFMYVEGIRHSGKSSLLQCIELELSSSNAKIVPVYHPMGSAHSVRSGGAIMSNALARAAAHPMLAKVGVVAPSEEDCEANMPRAYAGFASMLLTKLPDFRVLLMIDDMQALVEAGQSARFENVKLYDGIVGFLNLIRENGRPSFPITWLLAGQVAKSQFRIMMPQGVLLWSELRSLPIDFLDSLAIAQIIREPLRGFDIVVPDETVERIHRITGGHPEVTQQLAEIMLRYLEEGKCRIMAPADADKAALELVQTNDDLFADTWYPAATLSKDQQQIVANFVKSTKTGGSIEAFRIVKDEELTETAQIALEDLAAKKIIHHMNGIVSIKAYVLDLWLRRWVSKLIGTHQFGAPAIFVDVANLTAGKGTPYVDNLDLPGGDAGLKGRYSLKTVLEAIENYVQSITKHMVVSRWAVNYPVGSPAVLEMSRMEYYIKNIPDELRSKGSDDIVLMEKINDIERDSVNVSHFFLVLGDRDYLLSLERIVKAGKNVHIISRKGSLSSTYLNYAKRYPDNVSIDSLETVLTLHNNQSFSRTAAS